MADRILVTGADGFIGSHLVEALLNRGHEVRAFVYYHPYSESGWLGEIPKQLRAGLELFPGDVRDPGRVDAAVEGMDSVFHLAALIGIPYSYYAPASYLQTNVLGTQNVLDAALRHRVKKVLVTSSSEVYGTARYVPMDENHPKQPQSPYSASKIAADALALSYHLSFGLPVTIVRPFNTYGPRQSVRAFIPTVIRQLLGGSLVLKLGDLSPTRDLLYVEDTVRGFWAIYQSELLVGQEVNIATGMEYSMGRTLELLQGILKTEARVETDPERLRPPRSEVLRLCGDSGKLRKSGWSPSWSLEEGLKRTADWFGRREREDETSSSYRL